MLRRLILGGIAMLGLSAPASAGCAPVVFQDSSYTVCRFDPATVSFETFNLDASGEPFETFNRLAASLAQDNKNMIFAMNGGMFDDNLKPIGLYVEDGKVAKKLNRKNGYGNFHLKPNGVLWIDGKKAGVSDTDAFAKSARKPRFATQSGPMLVINGNLHPKFSETGTSRKIRNGVGLSRSGELVFAMSETAVTFHEFARLFRDGQDCPNALFLDGSVSGLYSTETGQRGGFLPLGPMVGAYEMK